MDDCGHNYSNAVVWQLTGRQVDTREERSENYLIRLMLRWAQLLIKKEYKKEKTGQA